MGGVAEGGPGWGSGGPPPGCPVFSPRVWRVAPPGVCAPRAGVGAPRAEPCGAPGGGVGCGGSSPVVGPGNGEGGVGAPEEVRFDSGVGGSRGSGDPEHPHRRGGGRPPQPPGATFWCLPHSALKTPVPLPFGYPRFFGTPSADARDRALSSRVGHGARSATGHEVTRISPEVPQPRLATPGTTKGGSCHRAPISPTLYVCISLLADGTRITGSSPWSANRLAPTSPPSPTRRHRDGVQHAVRDRGRWSGRRPALRRTARRVDRWRDFEIPLEQVER